MTVRLVKGPITGDGDEECDARLQGTWAGATKKSSLVCEPSILPPPHRSHDTATLTPPPPPPNTTPTQTKHTGLLVGYREAGVRLIAVDYTHPTAVNPNGKLYARHKLDFVMVRNVVNGIVCVLFWGEWTVAWVSVVCLWLGGGRVVFCE